MNDTEGAEVSPEYRQCEQCKAFFRRGAGAMGMFCSNSCDIAYANVQKHNGHIAVCCPARVEITMFGDTRPRYTHGACMPSEGRPVIKYRIRKGISGWSVFIANVCLSTGHASWEDAADYAEGHFRVKRAIVRVRERMMQRG